MCFKHGDIFSTNTIGTDSMLVRSLLDEDNWGQTSCLGKEER